MESNVHSQRSLRSSSATAARRSSSRSDSSSPFRRAGTGLLSVLRQKFSLRAARGDESEESSRHQRGENEVTMAPGASATLSWRSRRRRVETPIRPAYSDECLSCCGRSTCLRSSRTHRHRHQVSQESMRLDNAAASSKPVATPVAAATAISTSRKVVGIVICKHCHAKNDRSPSDFEMSHSEDDKMVDILPPDKEYGHAIAPTTASVTVTCDLITVHSSPHDCVTLTSSHIGPATSSSASGNSCGAMAAIAFNDLTLSAVPPTQPFYDQVKETPAKPWSLSRELFKLSKYGWYWGPITRIEAEEKLAGQTDGAFLVRDSSDDRYLLSLSFRSYGRTLHTRIEHSNGVFSFYAQPESEAYGSIVDLVEHSMTDSQSGVFCYSRARIPGSPSFPVRLARPVSRFAQVRTLQYLCRFCIRQYTRVDHIQQLPLPTSIKGWLEEGQY